MGRIIGNVAREERRSESRRDERDEQERHAHVERVLERRSGGEWRLLRLGRCPHGKTGATYVRV